MGGWEGSQVQGAKPEAVSFIRSTVAGVFRWCLPLLWAAAGWTTTVGSWVFWLELGLEEGAA